MKRLRGAWLKFRQGGNPYQHHCFLSASGIDLLHDLHTPRSCVCECLGPMRMWWRRYECVCVWWGGGQWKACRPWCVCMFNSEVQYQETCLRYFLEYSFSQYQGGYLISPPEWLSRISFPLVTYGAPYAPCSCQCSFFHSVSQLFRSGTSCDLSVCSPILSSAVSILSLMMSGEV